MEVFQFRKQFKHLSTVRENNGPEFQISDNVPKCRTLKENPDDYYKQAEAIRDRFIPYSSNLCINISHQMRKDLEAMDFRKLTLEQLAIIFDDAYRKIFSLLRDPFFRFRETYEYEALVRETKTSVSHQSGNNLTVPVQSQELLVVTDNQTVKHLHKLSQDINVNLFGHKEYLNDDKIHRFLKGVGDCFANCCTCKKS
ncbi:hypothetical protein RFI_17770 [Reticulomyxa filosa]|uniref:RGS domain-containing protein n=1 Tax=Reticulomyxa filosa TaxID=46433 RepID=X6N170_RETFI|nr:hypothetical protein RFI_17770 [Reticulomyxa filosa]|eukprot:ETO19459.1 hypothetical protein RFI_17770 [Reticulomyxa filosa]